MEKTDIGKKNWSKLGFDEEFYSTKQPTFCHKVLISSLNQNLHYIFKGENTMTEQIYNNPDIFKIYIPLPDNPLKNLNCYVLKTPNENLIIDTGFNREECLSAFMEGLEEIGVDLKNSSLFLTHLHSDHTGLIGSAAPMVKKIYMGKTDYEALQRSIDGKFWPETEKVFEKNGFPKEDIVISRTINPARKYAPSVHFNARLMQDGDSFNIGGIKINCVRTAGHTPGHMCLYMADKKIMFTGDHVLFDITPNITNWYFMNNSLGRYIESLEKIKTFDVETALPAHRTSSKNFYDRIDELLIHHKERLEECLKIISENPYSTAYFIASKMKWSMRGKQWSEFPIQQKWFAVGETIAHIDYLENQGRILKTEKDGYFVYSAKKD